MPEHDSSAPTVRVIPLGGIGEIGGEGAGVEVSFGSGLGSGLGSGFGSGWSAGTTTSSVCPSPSASRVVVHDT